MSASRATALVLDGHLASALAAVRDLKARGVRVIVGAPRSTGLALHSRFADQTVVYPDPKTHPAEYLKVVSDIASVERRRTDQPLVPFFFSDDTFLPFARASIELRSAFAWRYPELARIEAVFDKRQTLAVAEGAGLPVPLEVRESDLAMVPAEDYPLILKPRHSCVWVNGRAVRGTAERVSSIEETKRRIKEETERTGEAPLLQRCIVGEEVGVFTVCLDGVPNGWFSHRRLLGIHPDGGASSVRLSTTPPGQLVEHSSRLLKAMHWMGPAMVEWKYDQVAQTYRLMEINGRWWGSLALTLGADYPAVWLWYQYSLTGTGSEVTEVPKLNVQAVHLLAVVKCVLSCVVRGRVRQALQAIRLCFPMKGRTLVFDVESLRDPAPFFWEIVDVIARMGGTR